MGKLILEFDLEEELDDVEKVLSSEKIYLALWDFEQAIRSAKRYECGPIWDEFLKEKKAYPEDGGIQNMLDAIQKVYYELTKPFREFIE